MIIISIHIIPLEGMHQTGMNILLILCAWAFIIHSGQKYPDILDRAHYPRGAHSVGLP
jgi:hypothetical protein